MENCIVNLTLGLSIKCRIPAYYPDFCPKLCTVYEAGQKPERVRCTIGLASYTVHHLHRTLPGQGTSYQDKSQPPGFKPHVILQGT